MVLRMEKLEARPISPIKAKKRKMDFKPLTEADTNKLVTDINVNPQAKQRKIKEIKSASPVLQQKQKESIIQPVAKLTEGSDKEILSKDLMEKYPIFKDETLVQKFLSVKVTNNQKGRIRQQLRDSLKGTSEYLLPDVIYSKIQALIKSPDKQNEETSLRKIRLLYNMLKTALLTVQPTIEGDKKKGKKSKKKKDVTDKSGPTQIEDKINTEKDATTEHKGAVKKLETVESKKANASSEDKKQKDKKPKGPKRYVVFVGNLPPDIDKEKIMQHFSELNERVVDVRIPKRPEGKKSSIAYLELKDEPSYQLALSKHHSMLGPKRINVLYTAQKTGKVSGTEAKSKSAKLIALQKAGRLIGSVPANRKRSHRRMKMKRAQAKLAAENA